VQADLFELTQDYLAGAGLPAYEVSNHATPGEACRHNLLYWRSDDWLGIGPGAHGRLDLDARRFATEAWRLPKAWLERVERTGGGERTRIALTRSEQVEELLVMGLRLVEGVDLARLEALAGCATDHGLDPTALEQLVADGLLAVHGGRLAATAAGRQRLDALLAALSP
jgi:coproporphyrinogen III oxidase-like Fe-S oxidoreductase